MTDYFPMIIGLTMYATAIILWAAASLRLVSRWMSYAWEAQ